MAINSPSLVKAANEALVAVRPQIAIVKEFAFDLSPEFATAGDTVKVPVCSTGTLSAFNATTNNFEDGDGTLSWETVTLSDTVKATFAIPNSAKLDMPLDSYWGTMAKASANAVNKYISDKIVNKFNTTDITNTYTLSGDMTAKKAAKLRKQCEGRPEETVLILKSDWYNDLIGDLPANVYGDGEVYRTGKIDGLLGFQSVCEMSLPDGVNAVLLPKECLIVASRAFAVADESVYSEYGVVTDEETGFALTVMRHGSGATGGAFANVASMFGIKLAQTDKIKLVVNS